MGNKPKRVNRAEGKQNRMVVYFLIVVLALLGLAIALFPITPQKNAEGPFIYVANEGDGTISVISQETLEVVRTVMLEGMPHNVNTDPLGRYFFATNHEGEEEESEEHEAGHIPYLRILDAKSHKLLSSIPMADMAAHAVPSKDGKYVFVSREGGSTIVKVGLEDFRITRIFNVGKAPHGFVLSSDNNYIYSPNMKSDDISILDLKTGKEERINITSGGSSCETPVAMGIKEDGLYSFVTCGRSFDVYKIDNLRKKAAGRVAFETGEFPGPIQTPVHPGGEYLYVPDMRHGVVHKISIEPFKLVKDIHVGAGAHGIAYSQDSKTAFVTNTWEDTISVIDLETDTVTKTIRVGREPNGIAVEGGKNQGW